MAIQVDGAKAKHGAYIYRNLEELSKNGKVTLPSGETVALGKAVGEALGKVLGDGGVKALSSGSATRYKYISRVYFDAGITEADPDYSDIVNYYVSDSRMAKVLTYKTGEAPKDLEAKVRAVVEDIRNPKDPKVIEGSSVEGADGTGSDDSQGPENGADVGGSAEDSGPAGSDTSDNREPRPNGEGADLSENGARLERILTDARSLTVPDADDCAAIFAAIAVLRSSLESAEESDRLEGRATFERLAK